MVVSLYSAIGSHSKDSKKKKRRRQKKKRLNRLNRKYFEPSPASPSPASPAPSTCASFGSPSPLENVPSFIDGFHSRDNSPSPPDLSLSSPTDIPPPGEVISRYKVACNLELEEYEKLEQIKQQPPSDVEAQISNVERVYVREYLKHVQHRERTAVILARHYRDQLVVLREDLCQAKIKLQIVSGTLELEKQKMATSYRQKCNQIREFWCSKLCEGGSRSGKLVQMALNSSR